MSVEREDYPLADGGPIGTRVVQGSGKRAEQLRETYIQSWASIHSHDADLSDFTTFRSAAYAYATTADGERQLYADLAASDGIIAGILQDALDSATRVQPQPGENQTPRGYVLSPELVAQLQAHGVSLEAVVEAVDNPATTLESRRHPEYVRHIRDGVCVAVDRDGMRALALLLN